MSDPLLDFLNADDEPSAAEAQTALAKALRRKQDLGTLGVMSGGKLAAPGQSLLGSARSDEDALMHAGVSRTARLDRKNATAIAGMKQLQDLAAKKAEQARLDSQFTQRLDFDKQKLALEVKRHRGSGAAPAALGPDGQPAKSIAQQRLDLRTNALQPRPDWEPVVATAPTFRDAGQATKFDEAVAGFGAIQNHRQHALEALKLFHQAEKSGDVKAGDIALGKANAQMLALAAKLVGTEGLNSSDKSNATIEQMLALKDGSVATLRNLANQGRLEAILDAAIESSGANLETKAGAYNLRRKAAKAPGVPTSAQPASPAAHPQDAAALEWAKANPTDKRAADILKANGL